MRCDAVVTAPDAQDHRPGLRVRRDAQSATFVSSVELHIAASREGRDTHLRSVRPAGRGVHGFELAEGSTADHSDGVSDRPIPVELAQPPGGSDGFPTFRIVVLADTDDVENSSLDSVPADVVDELRHVGGFDVDGNDPVQSGRAPDRPPADGLGGRPDRDAGSPNGSRQEPNAIDRVVRAVEVHRLARPDPPNDLEPLVQHVSADPQIRLLAEGRKLRPSRSAHADAEHEPAAAELVEAHCRLGHVPGASAGQRGDERPQLHALGGNGRGGERHPRIDHVDVAFAAHHVIPDEGTVPTGVLRDLRQLGDDSRRTERPDVGDVHPALHPSDGSDPPMTRSVYDAGELPGRCGS